MSTTRGDCWDGDACRALPTGVTLLDPFVIALPPDHQVLDGIPTCMGGLPRCRVGVTPRGVLRPLCSSAPRCGTGVAPRGVPTGVNLSKWQPFEVIGSALTNSEAASSAFGGVEGFEGEVNWACRKCAAILLSSATSSRSLWLSRQALHAEARSSSSSLSRSNCSFSRSSRSCAPIDE